MLNWSDDIHVLQALCPCATARHSLHCMAWSSLSLKRSPHAQAVKSLGATLKTFQPTIREVLGVTQDLRNTLEEQIGLDDIRRELRGGTSTPPSWSQTNQFKPTDSYQWDKERTESSNGSSSGGGGRSATADSSSPSSDAEAAQTSSRPHAADEDLDSLRKQSASAAWGGQTPDTPQQQQQDSSPSLAGRW